MSERSVAPAGASTNFGAGEHPSADLPRRSPPREVRLDTLPLTELRGAHGPTHGTAGERCLGRCSGP